MTARPQLPRRGVHARARARAEDEARVVWPPREREHPREAIRRLMSARGLALRFEEAVEREARLARDGAPSALAEASAIGSRRDLRELPTFTIDPSSARDFDDAISAQRIDGGGIRVWVHIADVAAFVPEGSLLDEEARRRGTSVYVPGAVEPMLPSSLSGDACSLVPGGDRLAVSVELELDDSGVRASAFHRSIVRSNERLDYERVDRIFGGLERAQEPWGASLALAREAGATLERARSSLAGALVISTLEPEFVFDGDGEVAEIALRSQTESHRVIEQLMIAANEAVARLLSARRIPCLYRVHERPAPEAVRRLRDQLASLEIPTPPLPEQIAPSQAAELLGEISKRVETSLRRFGGRLALSALVLQATKQAFYSPENIGHAGLGSPCYCHFTSPIRRYPDLVCHRALLHALGEQTPAPPAGELRELGVEASGREREAMKTERAAEDIASCFALERLLYDTGSEQSFGGEVTGLLGAGAFVGFGACGRFSEHVFEGMLPVRNLRAPDGSREWWELSQEGTILRGTRTGASLRLGQQLEVRVARVDAPAGRIDLLPG
jgi:ribonuclease R